MATAKAETSHDERASPGGLDYDGFISYSHAADDLLAPRLQAGLQRFAKPWWKRRALRIFRDESSLSANPHLWSSITDALDQSGWFVLLLSPDAAESPWVNDEVEYWLEHKDADKIIPVLTDGDFTWFDNDFISDAAPPALQGAFSDEPRWVDLRFARTEEQLDLKNPTFSAAVADVASAIRGVPKDELESEEVLQHRRTTRTAWAAGVGLLLLALLAGAAAVFALDQRNDAQDQQAAAEASAAAEAEARTEADTNAATAEANAAEADVQRIAAEEAEALAASREIAASAIAVLDRNPELATLLAVEAIDAAPEGVPQPLEVINALWQAGSANRLVDVIETNHDSNISLSPDGTRLAATTGPRELQVFDPFTGESLWSYTEETVDHFAIPAYSGDGRVALSVIDSTAEAVPEFAEEEDELPNRILVLDGDTGELQHVLEFPECKGVDVTAWSPDAAYLAVGSGQNRCERNESPLWLEVYDTATWEPVAFVPMESDFGPVPRFDLSGRLYALVPWSEAIALEAESFALLGAPGVSGIGDVTPDGSRFVLAYSGVESGTDFSAFTFDAESGEVIDILYTGVSFPSPPLGVMVTSNGEYAIVGTNGQTTSVFHISTGAERFRLPTGEIYGLGYDPETERLYTSGAKGDVRVWDLSASAVGVDLTGDLGRFSWVNGNSFSVGPDFGAFDSIDLEGFEWSVRFFDPVSGELQTESSLDAFEPAALANELFAARDRSDPSGVLLDPTTGDAEGLGLCATTGVDDFGDPFCVGEGELDSYQVTASVDGTELLATGFTREGKLTGDVLVLDPASGEVTGTFRIEPTDPDFLIFTEEWAFGRDISGYSAINRQTGDRPYTGPFAEPIEVSQSGGLIAMGQRTSDLVVLDTNTWEEFLTIEGSGRIRGLAFDQSETKVAVADIDTMYVVDLDAGIIVQQMRLPGVSDIHWLDDETVLVGTNNGLFGIVSLSTEAFLDRTRASLRRSFTADECAAYRIDPCPTLDEMRGG